jgi:alanine dehydrogenase
MIIGVPKEIKTREYRIGMVPAGVRTLASRGHKVYVEKGAGEGSGLRDELFVKAGAKILAKARDVWQKSDMVIKVKEPLDQEFSYMKEGQILYTYLHLAATKPCTEGLLKAGVTGVAYETIQLDDGSLPLLRPMSQVAGRMSVQIGAGCLEKERGGKGILLGGVPGTRRGRVTILGGGTVGTNAAQMAVGLGADVTILDISHDRLIYLDDIFGNRIRLLYSDPDTVEKYVREADLVVGAVLVAGARAPVLVTEKLVRKMEPGSVIVDVAVDQGGCIETIHPTTHDNPTYDVRGVIHYGVANMPGAVAQTSTFALTSTTIGFAVMIADKGLEAAAKASKPIEKGINTYKGKITCKPVAEAHNLKYSPFKA